MDIHAQHVSSGTGLSGSYTGVVHKLIDVPARDVWHVKPDIEGWINSAAQGSSYFTADEVWDAIKTGKAQLWVVWGNEPDAVCVTQLTDTSKGKYCSIWIMVGSGMVDWLPLVDQLEAWAKREGCNMMRHEARPGWSKALKQRGYHMPHVILEKEL